MLKKASVLLFYGRVNDAFDEIAKAAQIIKEQKEVERENEEKIKKRWRFKLGLDQDPELPKPYDKVTLDDLTDDFLSKVDKNSADVSTIVLYIKNVCPLIREANDKNHFLNTLVEDLYLQTEGVMIDKQKSIDKIKKNVEKMGELNEIYEALGSDAEKDMDPEAFVDAEGNPIKARKKKKTMCDQIYKKNRYADEDIEMKTEDKHYISLKERTFVWDKEAKKETIILCPKTPHCNQAHAPNELDLIPITSNIANLQAIMKSQTVKLKNAKPIEPWRPAAQSFDPNQLEDRYLKKKFNPDETQHDDDEKKNRRQTILERENVFKKPYEKE